MTTTGMKLSDESLKGRQPTSYLPSFAKSPKLNTNTGTLGKFDVE